MTTSNDIPKELLLHSISDVEIVLPYPAIVAVIHRLPEFDLRLLSWEGWLRYPNGQVGHSPLQQGTVDLSDWPAAKAADLCISTIGQAHAEALQQPESGELYFCITVDAA